MRDLSGTDHVVVEREDGRIVRILAYDVQHDKPVHILATKVEFSQPANTRGEVTFTLDAGRVIFIDV